MAAGTTPIFPITPRVSWTTVDGNGGSTGSLKTANTAKDGTGTVTTVFTAGSNGSLVQRLRFRAAGTNVATVARVFINNGSTQATASNNVLAFEMTLPATTLSETAALADYEISCNIALPASYVLNVTLGTTVSAGYYVSAFGGDY